MLPDICIIPITDGTHQTPKYTTREDGIPFLSSKDVTKRFIDWSSIKYITRDLHDVLYSRIAPQKFDILLAKNGTTGVAAMVEDDRVFDIYVTLAVIRPAMPYIHPNYLLHIINSHFCKSQFNSHLTGIGLPNLHLTDINKTYIPLPPYNEQCRIVEKLENLLSVVDNIENCNSDIRESIQSAKSKVLDLAIHGKLVPQDANDEPASELLKRVNPKAVASCDNPQYGKVPSSWVISTVGEVFTINPKTHVEDDTEAAFVPMTCVADGYSNTFEYECRKWSDIKKGFVHFQENDVAVAKISPCLENRKSVVFHDLPNGIGAGTTELNVFRCTEVLPEYALFYFKSQMFIGSCAGTYNGVVGQQRVAKSFIQELPIGIPPYKEQLRIVSKVNDLFSQLDMIEKSLQA